jgi:hypothetical protein
MKRIDLIKKLNGQKLINTTPTKEHFGEVINEECEIFKNNKKIGVYIKVPKKLLNELIQVTKTTKTVNSHRTKKALNTRSSVFGFLPRNPMRQDYCRISEITKKEKNNFIKLYNFNNFLIDVYKKHLPEKFNEDLEIIRKSIKEEWKLGNENIFTTVSVNINHAIKYHKDTANYKGNYSNVIICENGIKGGELVFPEYKIALSQKNGFLLIFDGQSEIHGVMPVTPEKKDYFRSSIVFYALENMKHCYPFQEEIERIKQKETERAKKRAINKDPRSK